MKKGILYIVISALFINNISFNQLFKFPVLISHYVEHKQLNNQIGFIDFLSMHYWGRDLHDNDQERDNQLPFKKANAHLFFQWALPLQRVSHDKQLFVFIDEEWPIHSEKIYINKSLDSIFRPPKG